MFEFLFVIGIVLAFYGYSAMKNPNVWGDQGRDAITGVFTGTDSSAIDRLNDHRISRSSLP